MLSQTELQVFLRISPKPNFSFFLLLFIAFSKSQRFKSDRIVFFISPLPYPDHAQDFTTTLSLVSLFLMQTPVQSTTIASAFNLWNVL